MSRRPIPRSIDSGSASYLESLSDLLIGVLFVFMIILMSFALSLRVAQDGNQASQVANKAALRRLSDAAQLRNNLLNTIQSRMSSRGVLLEIDERNGILRLPESVLFDSASADFTVRGKIAIASIARELASQLRCYSLGSVLGRKCPANAHVVLDAVFIEGHTDDVPITGGPFKDNWELSAARSRRTYQALAEGAPELQRMQNANGEPLLSISAYGDTRPLKSFHSLAENRKHSRRIDLRFIIGTPSLNDLRVFDTN